jgi:hypothetical protein
LNIERA